MKKKHERAQKIMDQKNLRKTLTALKEMTKFMKALRVKQSVLCQNLQFLNGKRACQQWFMRTQITLMLRRRNQQVTQQYRLKTLKDCFNAIITSNKLQKRGIKKFE